MYACICHAVTEDEVADAVDAGASCRMSLALATGAGETCGTCHDRLEELIQDRCGACPRSSLRRALTAA